MTRASREMKRAGWVGLLANRTLQRSVCMRVANNSSLSSRLKLLSRSQRLAGCGGLGNFTRRGTVSSRYLGE